MAEERTGRPNRKSIGRKSYVAIGVILTVVVWLVADMLQWSIPPLAQWWPVFAVVGGLASCLDFFIGSRKTSSLARGVIGIGFGLLLLPFTTRHLHWSEMGLLWPIIPGIIFVATLSGWLAAGMRGTHLGIAACVSLGIALTGASESFGFEGMLAPGILWIILLLAMVGVLMRGQKG